MEYQQARLQYQFSKLGPIREGIYPEHGGNTEFELFSFFEICYHLKDWIKHSPGYKPHDNDVEQFINDSPALSICADLCNRLKHKTLSRPRTNPPPGIFSIRTVMTIGPDPKMARVQIDKATVETKRGEECCFALAEECMSEWARYFSSNKP